MKLLKLFEQPKIEQDLMYPLPCVLADDAKRGFLHRTSQPAKEGEDQRLRAFGPGLGISAPERLPQVLISFLCVRKDCI